MLPALPLHWTTAFSQPLRTVILALAETWDEQKRLLAARRAGAVASSARPGLVHFVEVPPDDRGGGILARDGVHPNESGYELWADHIAESLRVILCK